MKNFIIICLLTLAVIILASGQTMKLASSEVSTGNATSSSKEHSLHTSIGRPITGSMESRTMIVKNSALEQSRIISLLKSRTKPKQSLSDNTKVPEVYALNNAFPNPFNPSTIISYALPIDSYVTIKVYNTLGQEVATLVDEIQNADVKSVTFDASSLSSGIYFYRIHAQSESSTGAKQNFTDLKKILLIK